MKPLLTILLLLWTTPCLANDAGILTTAYESSSESLEGQIAVASVIKTRSAERRQTIEQVVYAKKQFSCWLNGKPTQHRKLSQAELDKATRAWNLSRIGLYNHYYAHDELTPYWVKSAVMCEVIGNHTFCKL